MNSRLEHFGSGKAIDVLDSVLLFLALLVFFSVVGTVFIAVG